MASGNLGVILHENGRGVLCGLGEKEARAGLSVSFGVGPKNNTVITASMDRTY